VYARFIQAGFWVSAAAILVAGGLHNGNVVILLLPVLLNIPFTVVAIHFLRCENCGVSYFYNPTYSWTITGVDLLKFVQNECKNCGLH
jgi:predicted nucleic-acid-binding Zn-ribbon protein